MKKLFFVLLVYAGLSACSGNYQSESTFKIINFEMPDSDKQPVPDSVFSAYQTFLKNAYIKFNRNDTITVLAENGNFAFGRSRPMKKQVIAFNLNNFGEFSFQVQEAKDPKDQLEYLVLTGTAGNFPAKLLLKRDKYFDSRHRDLLGLATNSWRLKPERKETREEIKKRVKAQLDYMISYFELIDEKGFTSFKTEHLIAPFNFYSNALGLRRDPDSAYRKIFFDREDSDAALEMLAGGLDSISAYPSDPKSFTKGYKNVFEEIRRYIEMI